MQSNRAPNGMVVTPHHLATQSAMDILRQGGTAIEAMVAAAATVSVVYPHMNTIGGDGFWLILPPNGKPVVIEACGATGSLATEEFFKGLDKIPYKGPKSAITVAGTVGGWQEALDYVEECGYQKISTHKLLADAIRYAEQGFAITESHRNALINANGCAITGDNFRNVFLPDGKIPDVGEKFCQKQLADTLKSLVENGLNSFYDGEVAKKIVEDMKLLGLPITEADLVNYTPLRRTPLQMTHKLGEIFNLPPPTQGVTALLVLGILNELNINKTDEGKLIHAVVEATKQAFELRDEYITDSKYMKIDPQSLLTSRTLTYLVGKMNLEHSSSVGKGKGHGDTIWMGAMDSKGFSVGFIQSIYHEFGSGVVLPKTGILWHNRGVAFTLKFNKVLSVKPGKKPLHTLNIAAAKLNDGRLMIYGARGGDGQPQTQAAIFHRYVIQNMNLQAALSAPRWIYGRNSGDHEDVLKIENRFSKETVQYLKARGHTIVMLPAFCETVGQAGALVRHPNGMLEGAFDLRSDGSAAGF